MHFFLVLFFANFIVLTVLFSLYFFSLYFFSLYFLGSTFVPVLFTQVPLVQEFFYMYFFSQVPLVHDFPPLKYRWYKNFLLWSAKKTKNSTAKMRDKMKNSTRHSYMYFYYGETGKRHPPLPNPMPVSVGGCIVDI